MKDKDKEALLIERRIQLLNDFHKSLKLWFRGNLTDEQRSEHRYQKQKPNESNLFVLVFCYNLPFYENYSNILSAQ